MIFRGLTMIVLDGQFIGPFPTNFQVMAAGFVPDFFGGNNMNIFAMVVFGVLALIFACLEFRKRVISQRYEVETLPIELFAAKLVIIIVAIGLFGYWFGMSNGIPNVLIVLGALLIVYSYLANRTVIGRHIYACGGNPMAAELSGIKTKNIVFWVYVNMGMLAALAGLIFAARLNVAMPRAGTGFELQAIAAAFIGGASPHGGVGKITGAIVGAAIVGIISNGMTIRGISVDIQQVITGLVLLAAVIFDVLTKQQAKAA